MKNSTNSVLQAMKKRKLKGFNYEVERLHGWELWKPPQDGKFHWVLTDDGVACLLSPGRVLSKWSCAGTIAIMHHMQEVTDEDFKTRNPPKLPEGIELVWE